MPPSDVVFTPLHSYSYAHPLPEPGSKAGTSFFQKAEYLPIPESPPPDATALDLLDPVTPGGDLGGSLAAAIQRKEVGGGHAGPTESAPWAPKPGESPIPPGSPPSARVAPQPAPTVSVPPGPPSFQVGMEKALAQTTPVSPTLISPVEGMDSRTSAAALDALPGMLETVYRALVASKAHGQTVSSEPLPFWEHSHLYVEEAGSIPPLGEDGGHHPTESHQAPHHPMPHEDLTEEAKSAYQVQADLEGILQKVPGVKGGIPNPAVLPPSLDVAG